MQYELTAIIPLQNEAESKNTLKTIENLIQQAGGEVVKSEIMVQGHLSYPIKKLKQGQHCRFQFQAETDKIGELQRRLRLSGTLIRFMVNKVVRQATETKIKEKPVLSRGWTQKESASASVASVPEETGGKPSLEELDKKLDAILKGEI